MPTLLRFEFYGDVQLSRTLADLEDNVRDLRPVWERLADRFVRSELRQFTTEGRYGSGGWDPLSPRYAAWKAANYPGKTILRRTDALFDSLTDRPLGIEIIEPHRMILGSDVEYGRYHQLGGDVDGRPPQRRPVEFPESERREWPKIMQRYLVTGRVS